jgi:hypothetical protein
MLPGYRRAILRKLARTAAMADIERRIRFEAVLTPEDIRDRGTIADRCSPGRRLRTNQDPPEVTEWFPARCVASEVALPSRAEADAIGDKEAGEISMIPAPSVTVGTRS